MIELLVGALVAVAFLGHRVFELRRERDTANAEARESRERLLMAHKDGFVVPPSAADLPPARDEEVFALSADLRALVDDWEDEGARAAQLQFIKHHRNMGLSDAEILRKIMPASE